MGIFDATTTRVIGKTATRIYDDTRGMRHVKYHEAEVVSFNPRHIVLRTGGWVTATTASRMNQSSRQWGLGYSVHRQKGKMLVTDKTGQTYAFINNIMLPR